MDWDWPEFVFVYSEAEAASGLITLLTSLGAACVGGIFALAGVYIAEEIRSKKEQFERLRNLRIHVARSTNLIYQIYSHYSEFVFPDYCIIDAHTKMQPIGNIPTKFLEVSPQTVSSLQAKGKRT